MMMMMKYYYISHGAVKKKQKEAARRVYLLTYVTLINIRATTTGATATANSSNFLHQI